MDIGNILAVLFFNPITNLLVLFFYALQSLHIPYALGFSIIVMTVFIRLLVYPFVSAQIKSAVKMQTVAPHIAKVREKHKSDARKQQAEIMRLYKEHGVNPVSGCLPVLIQIPIIWSLYHVLTTVVAANTPEKISSINNVLYFDFLRIQQVWDSSFFGISLSQSPSQVITTLPLIVLVPVLTGLFQFVLSKMMLPVVNKKKDKKKKEDFQSAFQAQSLFIFPVMIGFFSFTLPFGLSLYWNTFTIFGILQQYQLAGPGGLEPWIQKIRKNG